MKVAVIGCGGMGRTHASDYAKMPGAELAAVVDFMEEAAKSAAEAYGTQAYTDFDQMLDEVDPDVVDICLPTYLHKEYVIRAANRGKHVICEKPIAPTKEDAQEMIDVCRKQGVRLFVAHVVRFFPNYLDISRKVESGAIGKVGVVNAKRRGGHPGRTRPWYNDRAKTGSVIMDLMIHDIDFLRGMLGEVSSVYAMSRLTEHMEYTLVTLRFEQGAIANIEGFWGYPGSFTTAIEVAGSEGIIRFDSETTSTVKIRKIAETEGAAPVVVSADRSPTLHDPYYYELEHFLSCIRTGEEARVTAEDGLKAIEICLAAVESAETGQPVTFGSDSKAGRE
ncbi:dehydrogenase [Paenibacillus sp. J31TS4]|uniref:Gfo/Idh/MocA family protein n=1 Tax=Paenibacillus sp. J31TS4 TaxID=2807195 RepID=UPI001B19A873|nr:Gfo/Idh/MocA family oxidoreductase [Paenibacillus sp. J31TS4]GIP41036.1 dehydrogenase [Paenibacillus sp. J31TS4]